MKEAERKKVHSNIKMVILFKMDHKKVLFSYRVFSKRFRMISDQMFVTLYTQDLSIPLHTYSWDDIIRTLLDNPPVVEMNLLFCKNFLKKKRRWCPYFVFKETSNSSFASKNHVYDFFLLWFVAWSQTLSRHKKCWILHIHF